MSIVYIIQEPTRINKTTRQREAMMNFRPALLYGDLKVILESPGITLSPGPMVAIIRQKLMRFNPDRDFILAAGEPSAIMSVGLVLGFMGFSKIKFLKWEKKYKKYIEVEIDVK